MSTLNVNAFLFCSWKIPGCYPCDLLIRVSSDHNWETSIFTGYTINSHWSVAYN